MQERKRFRKPCDNLTQFCSTISNVIYYFSQHVDWLVFDYREWHKVSFTPYRLDMLIGIPVSCTLYALWVMGSERETGYSVLSVVAVNNAESSCCCAPYYLFQSAKLTNITWPVWFAPADNTKNCIVHSPLSTRSVYLHRAKQKFQKY
jgi:hypothetical protein